MKCGWQHRLLWAALVIPLSNGWTSLHFRKIEPNQVSYGTSLKVSVKSSSSPLLYKLPLNDKKQPREFKSIHVRGHIKGRLNLPLDKRQGEKGADDFLFKIGLVVPGPHRLGFFQRKLAADWILKLESLAPSNMGLDRVEFLTMVQDKRLLGQSRKHPLSDLLVEKYVQVQEGNGDFTLDYTFPEPIPAVALWLSADGDDTQSKFELQVDHLELEPLELKPGA